MSAAEQLAGLPSERLTWAQMQGLFPYQYVVVLLEDEKRFLEQHALEGRVLTHGRWPDEVCATIAPELWSDPTVLVGVFYTGVGMPDEDRDPVIIYR